MRIYTENKWHKTMQKRQNGPDYLQIHPVSQAKFFYNSISLYTYIYPSIYEYRIYNPSKTRYSLACS